MNRHNTSIGLNTSTSTGGINTYIDKLTVIETDCKSLQQKLEEVAAVCAEIASDISAKHSLPSGMKSLQNTVSKLAEIDNTCSQIHSALSYVSNEGLQKKNEHTKNFDFCDMYSKKMEELQRASKFNSSSHRFVSGLEGSHNLEPASTEELGDDDDLMVAQVQISTNCPLTQKEFKSPMKNPRCKHVYSKSAIYAHIKTKGASAECPASGCVQLVVQSELLFDRDMELAIKRKNRVRMIAGDNNSDSDDDDETQLVYRN